MRFHDQFRILREKRLVLTAGACLIWKGCARFRIDDVARTCGMAKGTCYRHFATTRALINAAVKEMDGAFVARLSRPPANLKSPRAILRWVVGEAVTAQSLNLSLHDKRAMPEPDAIKGNVWACCLHQHSCPYGDAVQSLEAIDRAASRLRVRYPVPPFIVARLLVRIVPGLLSESVLGRGARLRLKEQSIIDYLIDRLTPR